MTRYAQRTLIGQPGLANWGKAAAGGIGVVQGYGVATGGTATSISPSGVAYTLLSFTSDDNLVVSTAGLFDVLMFGGGGAGGRSTGGGGGAGGILQTTVYLDAATYAVDVGAGGAGTSGANFDGFGLGSSIGTSARNLSVPGGGYGGGDIPGILGRPGGAGGCSGGNYRAGGNGTSYNPSVSGFSGSDTAGGGGGGTTAVGLLVEMVTVVLDTMSAHLFQEAHYIRAQAVGVEVVAQAVQVLVVRQQRQAQQVAQQQIPLQAVVLMGHRLAQTHQVRVVAELFT